MGQHHNQQQWLMLRKFANIKMITKKEQLVQSDNMCENTHATLSMWRHFEKSVKQSESKMSEAVMNNDMKTQSLRRTIYSEQWQFCNLPDLNKQNHHFQWTNETWRDAQ